MRNKNRFLILLVITIFVFPFFTSAKNYPDGTLIRAKGDIKVYLIEGNKKTWIKSPEEFNARKFSWQKIKVVSKEEVTAIKEEEAITPLPSVALSSPQVSPAVSVSVSPVATPTPAKINPQLPAPDYIRADWLVSQETAKYGRIGQKIVFKYSEKTVDKIENFRLYEKKPGEQYFSKIADFQEVLSTGCEDINIDGEWMITEAATNQCGYWAIQRVVSPGGRELTDYRSAASYSEGEYSYYVAGADKDGSETPSSPIVKLVFLTTVGIFEPVNQAVTGSFPKFKWSIAGGWPVSSVPDYLVMLSDDQNAQNPLWTKVVKILAGQSDHAFAYDGAGLNPSKKYQLFIYGRYRASEHDPDYISISLTVPEFWIKTTGQRVSLWNFLKGLIFHSFKVRP